MIGALIIAWILTLFDVDKLLIDGTKELFNLTISTAGYYTIFFLVGVIADILSYIRGF